MVNIVVEFPRALELANVEDLSGVIGSVCADALDGWSDAQKRGRISLLNKLFERRHHRFQLANGFIPFRGIEVVERLVISAGVGGAQSNDKCSPTVHTYGSKMRQQLTLIWLITRLSRNVRVKHS